MQGPGDAPRFVNKCGDSVVEGLGSLSPCEAVPLLTAILRRRSFSPNGDTGNARNGYQKRISPDAGHAGY